MKKINCIDLFAGCGGITEGFEATQLFNTVAAVEWERAPVETLRSRLKNKWGYADADKRVLHFDLQRTEEVLHGWTRDSHYGSGQGLISLASGLCIDAVVGGPPCQAYSVAGRIRDENRMQTDYRNYLFESYINVVNHFKPKAFIFENVPGMLSAKPGGVSIVERITQAFEKIGYAISSTLAKEAVFDCAEYGVAQQRKRVIIFGVKLNNDRVLAEKVVSAFYEKLHDYATFPKKTAWEALRHYPKFFPTTEKRICGRKVSHGPILEEIDSHIPRYHNLRDIETFQILAEDIESGRNEYVSINALKTLYTERTGKISNVHKYHVIRKDRESNAIPAHLHKDGLRHIHPDSRQARSITPREAAALQSFPDDFIFHGAMGDKYKMIGNAVPPLFAEKVATTFYEVLRSYYA